MSFLKRAARGQDSGSESSALEEQYMKLFPKIGRDFVHREDLEDMLRQIMFILDPLSLQDINLSDDSEARARAEEYKVFLDQNKKGSDVYKDIINLDEDDE